MFLKVKIPKGWIGFNLQNFFKNTVRTEALIFSTGTLTPIHVNTEEAEIEMCNRHKRYFQETKSIGTSAWCKNHYLKGKIDVQRDICLFLARYSSSLKIVFICDGCSMNIEGCWYRCLYCIDMDLCTKCYKSGKKRSEHLDSHEIIELRLV